MGCRTEDAAISFTEVNLLTLNVVIQARSSESCTCLVHFLTLTKRKNKDERQPQRTRFLTDTPELFLMFQRAESMKKTLSTKEK